MSPNTTIFLGVAGLAVGLALAATILHASETRGTQTSHVQRSLYVKSPRTAQRLAHEARLRPSGAKATWSTGSV